MLGFPIAVGSVLGPSLNHTSHGKEQSINRQCHLRRCCFVCSIASWWGMATQSSYASKMMLQLCHVRCCHAIQSGHSSTIMLRLGKDQIVLYDKQRKTNKLELDQARCLDKHAVNLTQVTHGLLLPPHLLSACKSCNALHDKLNSM